MRYENIPQKHDFHIIIYVDVSQEVLFSGPDNQIMYPCIKCKQHIYQYKKAI